MTHWRTARRLSGGNQSPGLHIDAYSTRVETNSILPSSGSQAGQSLIDHRELGACCLFLAFLSVVGGLLVLIYVGLQSFIPQSV